MNKIDSFKSKLNQLNIFLQVIKYSVKNFIFLFILAAIIFVLWYAVDKDANHNIIDSVTIATAILAGLILLFDAYKSWEDSLSKKLTVFFVESPEEASDNKKTLRMAYIRASLTHEGDARSLSQQLGSQVLKRFLDDEAEKYNQDHQPPQISIVNRIELVFDPGDIDIFHRKSKIEKSYVMDTVVVIELKGVAKTVNKSIKNDSKHKIESQMSDSHIVSQSPITQYCGSKKPASDDNDFKHKIKSQMSDSYIFSQPPISQYCCLKPVSTLHNTNESEPLVPKELAQYIDLYLKKDA